MNKIQKSVLEYLKRVKEVTRGQIITVVSGENQYTRQNVQEAINLLLDAQSISIIGRADTIALTNKGHKEIGPWYGKINWRHYAIKVITYVVVFLLGLFGSEIKKLILNFFK